jgi:cell division septum initiation protein DivIVA
VTDDAEHVLDQLVELVETARAMPMSASCVVNRSEVLGLLDDARALLPDDLAKAQRVLAERAAVVAEGRAEAERVVSRAHVEADRLLEASAVWQRAQAEADRLLEEAHTQAETMRRETEEYVDAKLAGFEVLLAQTLTAVERGRSRLSGAEPGDRGDLTGSRTD